MKSNPVFDVVISTAGRFDTLDTCLNAIYEHATFPITITLIDDATKKEEKIHHKHLFEYQKEKDIRGNVVAFNTKRHEKQMGFGASYNEGARGAKAPFLTIMNDDVRIHEGYFDRIFEVMKEPSISIVGSKLLFPTNSTSRNRPAGKIQHVGLALDIHANVIHPLIGWSPENPKTQISREVFATTGALFTTRTSIFREVGGFDPIYGLGYFEDADYCLKVRQKGGRIWLANEASGTHYTNATTEKNPHAFGNQFQENMMKFRAKWATSGLLVYDAWTWG
jgi:GT2 family glycosyltransferase